MGGGKTQILFEAGTECPKKFGIIQGKFRRYERFFNSRTEEVKSCTICPVAIPIPNSRRDRGIFTCC